MVYVEVNGILIPKEINNMGTLLNQLRKQGTVRGRRWTIRRDKDEKLTEVKLIFNPNEYAAYKNPREMYGDRKLIGILETEREKKRLIREA